MTTSAAVQDHDFRDFSMRLIEKVQQRT
jgi:hypothetical protein